LRLPLRRVLQAKKTVRDEVILTAQPTREFTNALSSLFLRSLRARNLPARRESCRSLHPTAAFSSNKLRHPDFLFGPSVSFLRDQFFPMAAFTEVSGSHSLPGYAVGGSAPSGSIPTINQFHWKQGFSPILAEFRNLRAVINARVRRNRSAVTGIEPKNKIDALRIRDHIVTLSTENIRSIPHSHNVRNQRLTNAPRRASNHASHFDDRERASKGPRSGIPGSGRLPKPNLNK
jgi:hypothetical protein